MNDLLYTAKNEQKLKYRVPLSCKVDYLGYKVFCQADPPLGSDTLVYGPTFNNYFKHN